MSDGGRQHKPTGRAGEPQRAATEDPIPASRALDSDRGWPMTDPMRYVRYEREQASAQITRSLKAWRKQRGGGRGSAAVPQGGGAPLPESTRRQLEPHLGADVARARLHTSGESARAAEQMNARAFTIGDDVHFAAGELAPGTKEGDRLLAHELTHVVQARQSGVQRKAEDGGDEEAAPEVSQPHEPAEKEADAVADHVADRLHGGGESEHDAKSQPAQQPAPRVAAKLRADVIHRNTGKKTTTTPAATATPATATPATTPAPYDPKPRKPDELWDDCADAAKRTAAVGELVARGYNQAIVTKLLSHDNGKTMRPFVSVMQEDPHTQDRHILDGAGTIPDKKALALRVLRNDPPCPGKAGAFDSGGAADKAVAAALKSMPWPTLRDKIARGGQIEEDIAVAATGQVLVGAKVQAKELPPYAHPMGEGGRPLYPGDPEFEPEMKKLETPPGSGKYYKSTPAKGKKPAQNTEIKVDKSNPLTNDAKPAGVHVRIVPDASRDGGWFIHSAWPY